MGKKNGRILFDTKPTVGCSANGRRRRKDEEEEEEEVLIQEPPSHVTDAAVMAVSAFCKFDSGQCEDCVCGI
jgi:hypothetical protein